MCCCCQHKLTLPCGWGYNRMVSTKEQGRTVPLQIRLMPREKRVIKKAARDRGMTISAYVRLLVLHGRI